MTKTLEEKLIAHANGDESYAKRLNKILAKNGITDIDQLLKMEPREIQALNGVGDRALCLLGRTMTAEREDRKHQSINKALTLHDWFEKAGATQLEGRNLEKVLKQNGITSMDKFMKTGQMEFAAMPNIAAKRLERILETKLLILKDREKNKKQK